MGYMDTVGVENFRKQQNLEFKPDEWKSHLKDGAQPKAVQAQLESDDWLFGHGVLP